MRDKLVDALKGYACFLVVFGHVIMGIRKCGIDIPYGAKYIEDFIWTFHVDLFMFLSGYVYRVTGEWKNKGNRISFLKHKFVNLAIPYFVFSCFYICINIFVGGSNVNNEMTLGNVLWVWKTPIAQYWFLYDLFFLFFAYVVLSVWLSNWQITIILAGICTLASLIGIDIPMPFAAMTRMALPFGIGVSVKKLCVNEYALTKKSILKLMHWILGFVIVYYSLENNVLVEMGISVLGCFASIAFISSLIRIDFINRILLFICKYSFPIYLLHTIFTAGSRVVLLKCGIDNYILHVVFGSVCGFSFPIIGAIILNRIDIFNFLIYPTKVLKKWGIINIQ